MINQRSWGVDVPRDKYRSIPSDHIANFIQIPFQIRPHPILHQRQCFFSSFVVYYEVRERSIMTWMCNAKNEMRKTEKEKFLFKDKMRNTIEQGKRNKL